MAKVRGNAPMGPPQSLSVQGYAIQQAAWSPQRDMHSKAQRLLVEQRRIHRASRQQSLGSLMFHVDVVNASSSHQPNTFLPDTPPPLILLLMVLFILPFLPLLFLLTLVDTIRKVKTADARFNHAHTDVRLDHAHTDGSLNHAYIHSAAGWVPSPSAAWTADGVHVVMVSPPLVERRPARLADPPLGQISVRGYGDETFSRTLVVTNVHDCTDVPACKDLSLLNHGLGSISPSGNMMLWGELPLGTDNRDTCTEEVVAYSLPDLQRLYSVASPPGTLRWNAPDVGYQGEQKCAREIVWAPTGGLSAIHWAFGHARLHEITFDGFIESFQGSINLHGFSIHQAANGECLGSHAVVDPQLTFTLPMGRTWWDASGSCLIWTTARGVLPHGPNSRHWSCLGIHMPAARLPAWNGASRGAWSPLS